jgi:hypothetical protein
MTAAKNGEVWGIITIGENFTEDWNRRMHFATDNATLEGSSVHVYLDMTSKCCTLACFMQNSAVCFVLRGQNSSPFGLKTMRYLRRKFVGWVDFWENWSAKVLNTLCGSLVKNRDSQSTRNVIGSRQKLF